MKLFHYLLLTWFCISCVNDRADCNYPFLYTFYNHTVSFPMSADEAVNRYGLLKTKHRILVNSKDSDKIDVSVYYAPYYELARYVPRTAKATQPYYNTDIYAVGFHFRDPALTMDQVMKKLSKDFNKEFVERRTSIDRQITYYQLAINDCELITVTDAPDYMTRENFTLVFTYKLIPPEVNIFMRTDGRLWVDD